MTDARDFIPVENIIPFVMAIGVSYNALFYAAWCICVECNGVSPQMVACTMLNGTNWCGWRG